MSTTRLTPLELDVETAVDYSDCTLANLETKLANVTTFVNKCMLSRKDNKEDYPFLEALWFKRFCNTMRDTVAEIKKHPYDQEIKFPCNHSLYLIMALEIAAIGVDGQDDDFQNYFYEKGSMAEEVSEGGLIHQIAIAYDNDIDFACDFTYTHSNGERDYMVLTADSDSCHYAACTHANNAEQFNELLGLSIKKRRIKSKKVRVVH